jgi:uncharacterized damage-inducible protein DinB
VNLDQLFSHWDTIHRDTIAVIDKFTDSELTTISYEGGWSVAEIALHIANAEEGWFRAVVQKKYSGWPPSPSLIAFQSKQKITTLLKDTHIETKRYLHSLAIEDLEKVIQSDWGDFTIKFIIWHVIEHEIHHRGELSLILGLLGREGLDV